MGLDILLLQLQLLVQLVPLVWLALLGYAVFAVYELLLLMDEYLVLRQRLQPPPLNENL